MGKIYNPPTTIEIPQLNFKDINGYNKACDKYISDLKDWCIIRVNAVGADTTHIGEVIRFPVADGYAEYMVASLKPVQLIHIPLWDAWDYPYIHKLSKKEIVEKINQQKSIKKLFG